MEKKPTAEQILKRTQKTKLLIKKVFSTIEGKKLLKRFDRIYVRERIFCGEDTHNTSYYLGQRDLILQITEDTEEVPGEQDSGNEVVNIKT